MDINRLRADELTYELDIRGFNAKTVDEMRKVLRSALRRGSSFLLPAYPFSFEEDVRAIRGKIDEVGKLVAVFQGDENSSEYKKVVTKTEWIVRRIDRVDTGTEEGKILLGRLRREVLDVLVELDDKANVDDEAETGPSKAIRPPPPVPRLEGLSPTSPGDPLPALPACSSPFFPLGNRVPVMKWGLKFRGESQESLCGFLERVEELREARGFSEAELFQSALDLFEGKATIWFRANRPFITDWRGLVARLRGEFLPADYDDRLWEEIRKRTQGRTESIGIYVSNMLGLFSRLGDQCPVETKLRLIRRNLLPFYQSQLALAEISSLDDLISVGRRLEATRHLVESYHPPPSGRSASLLEPDLAYVDVEPQQVNQITIENPTCFRCQQRGHMARQCPQPVRCYGCGLEGVIRSRCPKCSKTQGGSGNGAMTQPRAGQ